MKSRSAYAFLPGTHRCPTPAATAALARRLAGDLRGGEVVALIGDLGAGKTTFTRGVVNGLGGDVSAVHSPTFGLLHVYDPPVARLKIYHLDAYRLRGEEDLEAIGWDDLLADQGAVVVIEWADRVRGLLPPGRTLYVTLVPTPDGGRTVAVDRPPAE